MDFGFIQPKRDKNDKVFGAFNSLPKVILESTKNWYNYLPLYERQYFTLGDSYGCSVFGTLNALETILKKMYGKDFNFSERFNYNLINLKPPGADPKEVAQSIRDYGVIDQRELSYVDNFSQFASPRPMTRDLIEKGHEWLNEFDFGYEWVFESLHDKSERLKRMRECLSYSPLGISVDGWTQNDKGEFISTHNTNNHWCVGFRIDEFDRVWVFDTYDQSIKILSADHDIQFCMRYHLITLKDLSVKLTAIEKILFFLKEIFGLKEVIKDIPVEPVKEIPTEKSDLLTLICQAITDFEGKPGDRNYINNNPGNVKYSTVGYLPKYGEVKKDNRNFAIFKDYETGWLYLKNLVLDKCKRHPEWNLVSFFKEYAPASDDNQPEVYASFVAKRMGVNLFTFTLKNLL